LHGTANAEATLSGSVHRREEKRWLEELAEDVFGVQEVHNHLRVARHGHAGASAAGGDLQATPLSGRVAARAARRRCRRAVTRSTA
jgi:hypothetical protein